MYLKSTCAQTINIHLQNYTQSCHKALRMSCLNGQGQGQGQGHVLITNNNSRHGLKGQQKQGFLRAFWQQYILYYYYTLWLRLLLDALGFCDSTGSICRTINSVSCLYVHRLLNGKRQKFGAVMSAAEMRTKQNYMNFIKHFSMNCSIGLISLVNISTLQ